MVRQARHVIGTKDYINLRLTGQVTTDFSYASGSGVYDLAEVLNYVKREDGHDSSSYAYWLASIGDPKTDAEMLKAASPALRAAEITAPVLLIHGTKDKIVDPKQSKIMVKALKAAGKTYEYVELKGEGHRDWLDRAALGFLLVG